MNEPSSMTPQPEEQPHHRELADAIQALIARLGEVVTGPEGQRVKNELEASAQDLIRQIDQALEGPAAQGVKDRLAALIRTVQSFLK